MTNKLTYEELEKQLVSLKEENETLKKSKNENAELQQLIQLIPESIKDIIIVSIDTNYRYQYYNSAHKDAMKLVYNIDIQLGMNILDCITIDEDRKKAQYNYSHAIAGNSHSNIEEYGDGPFYYYESFFNPIKNSKGEIIGATALALNITEKVEAERSLSEREANHKAMIANIGDVIGVVGVDGKMKYKSSNIEKLFGWKPEELIGIDAFKNIHPDDLEFVGNTFTELLKTDQATAKIEFRYRHKNNKFTWVELNAVNNINNPAIEGVLINYHDISDRKNAEEELITREEEYRKTVNALLVGVVVHDKDAKILLSNPEASKILGLSAEQLKGKGVIDPAWKFVYEDLSAVKIEDFPISKVLLTQKPLIDYTLGIHRSDRDYITWAEINAMPIFSAKGEIDKVIINFVDITDRKIAEGKLLDSEQTFRALFEKGPIGVAYHKMIYDETGEPKDYLFLAANSSYQRLTGVDPTGKLVTEAFPGIEKDPFNWIGTFGKVAKTGEEIRFQQHLEPNNRWYDCVGYQYKQDHFVAAFLEITDQKRAESRLKENQILLKEQNEEYLALNEELNERNNEYSLLNDELQLAKEKAEESDRLKTAFLQNMSHEIRTPMNAICGFTDLLKSPNILEEKRQNFISIIQNSSNQLLSIVTDILTISAVETNQEKPEIQQTNINDIINHLLSIFDASATNTKVSLLAKKSLSDKASEIFTDKTKVTQVLTNLISNALKFTHEGEIEFGYTVKNQELEFFVKDTGIGIKPELQAIIFDRFRQADRTIQENYGGTGLGLAISKGFIELLSGKIWVESEVNKGATFYFTLPYKPVNVEEVGKPENKQYPIKTVLVAEDEIFNFLYIQEVFSEFNVNIIHAENGQDAVNLCKEDSNIDLILMDIKMPILDGYEAAKQIRKIRPKIRIIAQSAYALESDRKRFSGEVFDDYIAKPIKKELLTNILDQSIK